MIIPSQPIESHHTRMILAIWDDVYTQAMTIVDDSCWMSIRHSAVGDIIGSQIYNQIALMIWGHLDHIIEMDCI